MSDLQRFSRPLRKEGVRVTADVGRVIEIVEMSIAYITEILGNPDFEGRDKKALEMVNTVLMSGATPPQFAIPLFNSKMNDLVLNLDIRKRKITAVSDRFPGKRAQINAVLRTLHHG